MTRIISFDVGTAFLQMAEQNKNGEVEIKTMRNAFVELENQSIDDIEEILKQNNWQYVTDGKHYFVVGDNAISVCRVFPNIILRRPMQDGVLNKEEDKKMLVLASMIESMTGKAPDNKSLICFSVSSESIDQSQDSVFHKNRINSIFQRLGWKTKIIEEGMAVILSENPKLVTNEGEEIPYSGLGISLGGGRANAVLAYKGLQILGMSCSMAGDWVDKKVHEQTGTPLSQISYIKENKLDFNNIDYDNDEIFAIDVYYSSFLQHIFKKFSEKFKTLKSQFDEGKIPIVFAGGTSSPPGFQKKAEKVIKELDLPFKIKDVSVSKDPRNSVVKGLLVQAHISYKKMLKDELEEGFE